MIKPILYLTILFCALPMNLPAQSRENQIHVRGENISRQAGELQIELTVDVRTVRVSSNDALILIPQVALGDRVKELPRIVLNGRKRHKIYLREQAFGLESYEGEIYRVMRPDAEPAIVNYHVILPYEPWMEHAALRLRQETCGCPGEKKLLADNPLIDDLFPVPPAPPTEDAGLYLHFMEPGKEEVKTRSEYGEAYLNFIVNKWDILYDYKDNARKLDQVQAFFRQAQNDKNIVIDGITIIGYASPEGTWEHNMRLSENRASAFANWVQSRFPFARSLYSVDWRGEDWEKLRTLVEESHIPDRYSILNIIDNTGIQEGREIRLMNLNGGRTYKYLLDNLFPQLRRTYYRIDYTVRPFTAEESREIIREKPQQLSLWEMYSAANTYRRGSREYNAAMSKGAELFPQDPAANNNAAAVALQEGDIEKAKGLLDKTPDSPSKQNNLGVYYMLTGDWTNARAAFTKAMNGGIEDARHNLEILNRQLEVTRERERREAEQKRLEEQRRQEELRLEEEARRAREEAERKQRMEELNRKKTVPYRIQ